jgi:hypothetical protein
MTRWLVLLLVPLFSGCAAMNYASMQNRVACPVGGPPALVVSMWGVFGVATILASQDSKVICSLPGISQE